MSLPYRWMSRASFSRVVDGDTLEVRAIDPGFGLRLTRFNGPSPRPYVRLVGPNGAYFDAAESRGKYAQEAGARATEMLRAMMAPFVVSADAWFAIETFKPDPRDDLSRWLVNIVGVIEEDGMVRTWDPTQALVEQGVAVYNGRYPRP